MNLWLCFIHSIIAWCILVYLVVQIVSAWALGACSVNSCLVPAVCPCIFGITRCPGSSVSPLPYPATCQLLLERGLKNPGHCASRPSHLAGRECLCRHHWCFGLAYILVSDLLVIWFFCFFFRLISFLGKSYKYNTKSFLLSQILECDFLTNKDTSVTTI